MGVKFDDVKFKHVPPPSELVQMTLQSLIERSADWKIDSYYVTNDRLGLLVWLANSYYGVSIQYRGVEFGGVTSMSTFFGRLIPWRRAIFNAGRTIQRLPLKQALAEVHAAISSERAKASAS